jgi:malate dehydrogenase (oxaloacetate-decarboxylating)(NADP+)
MKNSLEAKSLAYHSHPQPGKIRVQSSKPCTTQQELSMAYTPGVAAPCLGIKDDPMKIWDYTAKGNMVAVVSDGTAVLGLGNIGPGAGLPVMEGKAVLFKQFADIDAVPICLDHVFDGDGRTDAKKLIDITAALEPSFGGINLEDIGAPACFEVEQTLKGRMGVPVFHDDQHGTAIISLAALLNALKLTGKRIDQIRVVVSGAGAAGIASTEFYIAAGVRRENVTMCDIHGVVYRGRTLGMSPQMERLAADTAARTLAEALVGADFFLGVSAGRLVTPEMVRTMAPDPIIFAMANPVPEITPEEALAGGAAVVGTGRTDLPNQINNVLGFPGIFRGALDTRATDINERMKIAAAKALAELAQEEIPAEILAYLSLAYPEDAAQGLFAGRNPLKATYVIPKPFDPRVVPRVARRVAEAAMETGVSRQQISDLEAYERSVFERISRNRRDSQ